LIFITVGKRSATCGETKLSTSAWKAVQNNIVLPYRQRSLRHLFP